MALQNAETGCGRGFIGASEEGLQTDADAHERFTRLDVALQYRNDTLAFEGGYTMPEITDAAEEDFLGISLGDQMD